MTRVMWVALVVGCWGCSSPTPKGPTTGSGSSAPARDAAVTVVPDAPLPLDRDLPRLAQRGVKLYEDVVAVFQAAGEDCSTAATRLGELAKTYSDVTAANATVLHEGRSKELRTALAPYEQQFEAAARSIMESKTLARCAQDGTFARAFDELVGAPP